MDKIEFAKLLKYMKQYKELTRDVQKMKLDLEHKQDMISHLNQQIFFKLSDLNFEKVEENLF